MLIRSVTDLDWDEWRRMRCGLWPEDSPNGHEQGMRDWVARPDTVVFVACDSGGALRGFVEVGSRPYADGCSTSPVAFIEGWYVDAGARRQGVGRALLAAAEAWARAQDYREMASDALLDNTVAHRAHEGVGYEEVGRVVQFRKVL